MDTLSTVFIGAEANEEGVKLLRETDTTVWTGGRSNGALAVGRSAADDGFVVVVGGGGGGDGDGNKFIYLSQSQKKANELTV